MSMKNFSYRVFKETKFEDTFSVKECYFNENGEIIGVADEGVKFEYMSIEDMNWFVDKINKAIKIGPIEYPNWYNK